MVHPYLLLLVKYRNLDGEKAWFPVFLISCPLDQSSWTMLNIYRLPYKNSWPYKFELPCNLSALVQHNYINTWMQFPHQNIQCFFAGIEWWILSSMQYIVIQEVHDHKVVLGSAVPVLNGYFMIFLLQLYPYPSLWAWNSHGYSSLKLLPFSILSWPEIALISQL
jgi:hypothetical protein